MPIQFGKITNNGIFANATATVENGFVRITAPPEADKINFYAPADFSLATVYTVNGVQVELANMQDSIPSVSWITGAPLSCIYEKDEEKLYISTMYGDSALHSAVFINSTAIMQDGVMVINSPDNAELINFITPSDASEVTQVTVNGTGYPLTDLAGSEVPQGWVSGVPISLVLHDDHLWLNTISTGGSGGATHDLPPLNPNFTLQRVEGENKVIVQADKLTISKDTEMLDGGVWVYGDHQPTSPNDGTVKLWQRDELLTSGKPFDGLLLGDVTASDAANETVLWLPENQSGETVLVPFIVLSTDYLGGVYLRRKNATVLLRGQNAYPDSEIDVWCESTYLNSILDSNVVSVILSVDIQTDGTSINRKCFILSATEYDSSKGNDGTAMPYFSTAANRITRNDSGAAVGIWTRTKQQNFTVYVVDTSGAISGQYILTNDQSYACPAFVLPKDFQIQQRPDGSYTVYNDYGLLTLGEIEASSDTNKVSLNILEKINDGSNRVSKFIYAQNGYGDNDGALVVQEIPFCMSPGNVDYSASTAQLYCDRYTTGDADGSVAYVLDSSVQNILLDSYIQWMYMNTGGNYLTKKGFILSAGDLSETYAGLNWGSGHVIPYFSTANNRIAKEPGGTNTGWWTRDSISTNNIMQVNSSGSVTTLNKGSSSYVRFTFMLPLTAPIRLLADGTYDLVPEDPALSTQTTTYATGDTVSLSDIPVSAANSPSTVKITEEDGTEHEYLVLVNNYQDSGGILLQRYNATSLYSASSNDYASESDQRRIATENWAETNLPQTVRDCMIPVTIPYRSSSGSISNYEANEAFLLSGTEVGGSVNPATGSAIPYFNSNAVRIKKTDANSAVYWWTRDFAGGSNNYVVTDSGSVNTASGQQYIVPAFVLSPDTQFIDNGDGSYTLVGKPDDSPIVSLEIPTTTEEDPVWVRQYTFNQYNEYQTMLQGSLASTEIIPDVVIDPVFGNNSWEVINYASQNGLIPETWQIGDTKDEVINDETLTFAIMDFNHDDLADGSGKAGITMGMTQLMASTRQMNSSNTNTGSFAGSAMYTWLSGTLYPSLPTELKDAIKAVNKKTSSGGGSSSIRTDAMYLWLFSEIEVFGSTTYSYAGEGTQYPYFATTAERIKKLSNGSGAASYWWERSPHTNAIYGFCASNSAGEKANGASLTSYGVCFGFCI